MTPGKRKRKVADRKRKVLLVDDDPHIVRLLEERLKGGDLKTFKAGGGLEAIRIALKENPEVIILDVMMPHIDGYQICRFVKSIPGLRRSRVIFLTVKQGVGDRQRGLLRGADDYLTKPFDMGELEQKVREQISLFDNSAAEEHGLTPLTELPAPEEITDEVLFSLMNRILDDNVHRFTLLEQISKRLVGAADRGEIIKTALGSIVSPVGLAWDRVLLMTVDEEGGVLSAELAFALGERPEDGLSRWRELVRSARNRTMEELLERGLKDFRFQTPRRSQFLKGLKIKVDTGTLILPADGKGTAMEVLQKSCGSRRIDNWLERIFWNREVVITPVAGRERVFGLVAADRSFSNAAVQTEDVEQLNFLCRQTGLALERQLLHLQSQNRAERFEQLSLLNDSIMDSIDLGVVYLDGEGRVGSWNRAMAAMTGVSDKSAAGRKFFSLFPSLQGSLLEKRTENAWSRRRQKRVGHYECTFKRGRSGIFDIRIGLVRSGRKALGMVMIWEDVQLRVRLEQKAREAFRYLSGIIAHSGDAIVTFDAGGRIKSWNGAAVTLFGYAEPQALGKAFSLLFEKGNKRAARALLSRTLREGKVVDEHERLLHSEGETIEVSITTATIDDEVDGKPGISAIIRDVSERRRMESQLFQTEKLASLGIVAAGMAHEINNPLTSIMMYSQILCMSDRMGDEDRSCIDKIEEDAGRIADIVNSLLVFSRPSSRRTEKIDLHETIEKAITFARYQSGRKNVTVAREFGTGIPALRGVATEIQEIFLNLLINAKDALDEKGEIRVATRHFEAGTGVAAGICENTEGGYVEVSVADDGCGIPKEQLKKVYDPFFTTKPPGKGTGLGLAVVRRLVENHQGCITVRSREGEGTTFSVFLPV